MSDLRNLELLKKLDYEKGFVIFHFKDRFDDIYDIKLPFIESNNNNISPVDVLCKMYNVTSIDEISYVRGYLVEGCLQNIGHIVNEEWLVPTIELLTKYKSCFDGINNISKNEDNTFSESSNIIKYENSKVDCLDDVKILENELEKTFTCYERNTYRIYKNKLILEITRQRGEDKLITVEMDKELSEMLQTQEWRFAKDKTPGLYFVNGEYENKTNPNKYGGKEQIWLWEYCYGVKPRFVKFKEIKKNYYVVKTDKKPLSKTQFTKNYLEKYQK